MSEKDVEMWGGLTESIHVHACALVDSYLHSCMHVDPYKHMQAAYLDYFNQLRMASVDRRLDFLVC